MKKVLPSRINPRETPIKLDARDLKLLGLLGENSREPYSSLAKKISLSRESIAYRTNRFLDKGVIVKTFAKIALDKLGWIKFRVFFNLDEHKPNDLKNFITHLTKHPNTIHVIEYSDRWDIEWKVVARNVVEFDDLLTQVINEWTQVILESEKMQVIKDYLQRYVPEMLRKKETIIKKKSKQQTEPKVDDKDMKILEALNDNAQMSTYKLAEKINMSADGIGLRIKKLKAANLIDRFTILANLAMLGYSWYTFVITLAKFDTKHEAKLKEFIRTHPNIIKCEKMFGNYDLLFYIVVKNQIEFHNTINDLKHHFAEIFRRYDTWVVYHEHFVSTMPKILMKK